MSPDSLIPDAIKRHRVMRRQSEYFRSGQRAENHTQEAYKVRGGSGLSSQSRTTNKEGKRQSVNRGGVERKR